MCHRPIVALLMSAVALSAQVLASAGQNRPSVLRIYIFTATDPARPNDPKQKPRQDTVRDLEDVLRQKNSLLLPVRDVKDADLTLEVMSRTVEAIGQTIMTEQPDAKGERRLRSSRVVGRHKLVVMLRVPGTEYQRQLTSGDLTWRSAAKAAIERVRDWVKANGEYLAKREAK